MEYYNIIILVIIFLLLLISFYLIINNLGIKSNDDIIYKNNYDELTNELLEQKLLILKNELSLLKNKIYSNNNDIQKNIITEQNNLSEKNNLLETNSISNNKNEDKEIIIEQDNTSNNITKPPPIIYNPIANYDIAKLTDPLVDPRGRTSADQIPTPQVAMQFNFPTQGVLDRYHRIGLLIAIDNNKRKNKNLEMELPYSKDSDLESNSSAEFIWNGPSKTNINKKNKKFISMENNNKTYNGVEIKENFDNYSDSDSYEYFGNTDKSITNIYNVYSNNNDNNILELIGKKITDNWFKYFTSITMGNKVIKVVVHNKNRKELYSGDIIYIPELKKTYRVKIDPMDMVEYNPYLF